jgi:hypothetical protein
MLGCGVCVGGGLGGRSLELWLATACVRDCWCCLLVPGVRWVVAPAPCWVIVPAGWNHEIRGTTVVPAIKGLCCWLLVVSLEPTGPTTVDRRCETTTSVLVTFHDGSAVCVAPVGGWTGGGEPHNHCGTVPRLYDGTGSTGTPTLPLFFSPSSFVPWPSYRYRTVTMCRSSF